MSYEKYHTEALVLGSREWGEADRVFALYTRDFGLVHARAVSVRKERSRLRYALPHYTRAHISLVRGNGGWKITGATLSVAISPDQANAFARISQLMLRLIAGEEVNEYVFAALSHAHVRFSADNAQSQTIELMCVARVLFALGYLSVESFKTSLFTHSAYEAEHLHEATVLHDQLLSSVNRAIVETQL